jgi:hypothetical protein
MNKFDEFVKAILEGAQGLARQLWNGYEQDAKADAQAFVDKAKADLERWTKLVAAGTLSKQDLTDLVKAKEALAEIAALTKAGVALAEVDRFRSGLINLVIDSAFKIFV